MNEDRKKRGLANGKFFTAVAICALAFSAGYQMYLHGYLRWVTTVDTQWAGDNDRLVNNRKGYVRCVRDLE